MSGACGVGWPRAAPWSRRRWKTSPPTQRHHPCAFTGGASCRDGACTFGVSPCPPGPGPSSSGGLISPRSGGHPQVPLRYIGRNERFQTQDRGRVKGIQTVHGGVVALHRETAAHSQGNQVGAERGATGEDIRQRMLFVRGRVHPLQTPLRRGVILTEPVKHVDVPPRLQRPSSPSTYRRRCEGTRPWPFFSTSPSRGHWKTFFGPPPAAPSAGTSAAQAATRPVPRRQAYGSGHESASRRLHRVLRSRAVS